MNQPISLDLTEEQNKDQLLTEEQQSVEIQHLKDHLKEAEHDRDLEILARQRADHKAAELAKKAENLQEQIKNERESFRIQLRRTSMRNSKSIKVPCLVVAAFAVLAMLMVLCMNKGLMSHLLGEPVGYGCLAVCAFFAGVVWDRAKNHGGRYE